MDWFGREERDVMRWNGRRGKSLEGEKNENGKRGQVKFEREEK